MRWRSQFLRYGVAAGFALMAALPQAQAAIETFNFSVTATTGPLAGTSASGSFSFDSSVVPAGGGEIDATAILTALSFTWHGISYTAATANSCQAFFDGSGALVGISFSGQNFPGGCGVESGQEGWNIEWLRQSQFFSSDFFVFTYAEPGHFGDETGTASITPASVVAEPGTLSALGAALAAFGWLRRRRKQRAGAIAA